jgi:hypothetical protein
MNLLKLFKKPYKMVQYSVFYDMNTTVFAYAPLEAEIANPYPINQNVFIFPEEENVIIKKIKSNFTVLNIIAQDRAVKQWSVNFQLLNRTEGLINTYPARVANPLSGSWSVPGTSPVYTGTVNSSKSTTKFDRGILAGGIRIATISQLGESPLLAPFANFVRVDISVYYVDNDRKKLLC